MTNEFSQEPLRRAALPEAPMDLFQVWFEEARSREPWDARAMMLSTVGAGCTPSARVVLMRGADANGFRFYTNYDSRKGHELSGNQNVAAVFWWPSLVRQIRVEGSVQKLDPLDSDAYFATRPRGSRIGAWGSAQSAEIESRQELENQVALAAAAFEGQDVSRPPNWGGYIIIPQQIEFWQGGRARLHDRFRYTREFSGAGWAIARLAP